MCGMGRFGSVLDGFLSIVLSGNFFLEFCAPVYGDDKLSSTRARLHKSEQVFIHAEINLKNLKTKSSGFLDDHFGKVSVEICNMRYRLCLYICCVSLDDSNLTQSF